MANYYYLTASLPELSIDNISSKFDPDEIFRNIYDNIEKEDQEAFRLIVYANDIKNIVKTISENYEFNAPHKVLSAPNLLSEDALKELDKNTDQLPDFLSKIYEEYHDKFASSEPVFIENTFLQGYYNHLIHHSNRFIRTYFSFDLSLRNIIAAINCRKNDLKIDDHVLEDENTSAFLLKSSAKDFGLGDIYPFIVNLEELIMGGETDKIDKQEVTLRWQMIDELTNTSFFTIDNLMGYCLKLFMVKRILYHDADKGKEQLEQLINNAIEKTQTPVV